MRCLIITSAGCSTRFSQSVGYECLKCLYYENDFRESLLFRSIMNYQEYFDKIIIVGGFHYSELQNVVKERFTELANKLLLVENPFFKEYGSGYSFLLGLREAVKYPCSEIIFMEGDLFVQAEAFKKMCDINDNIISTNKETILANKSVAFYQDKEGKIHYIFDTSHNTLEISEPFISIRNSGQIWKMINIEKLKQIIENLTVKEQQSTNLVILQKYFGNLMPDEYQIFEYEEWINCNSVDDYRYSIK